MDESLRELERQAEIGDDADALAFARALERAGRLKHGKHDLRPSMQSKIANALAIQAAWGREDDIKSYLNALAAFGYPAWYSHGASLHASDLIAATVVALSAREVDPEAVYHVLSREQEVWDVEVDHEDHNFALASGIFVHNSQYAASVETVHSVITSAEDEDGNLKYLDLTVNDVRAMRHRWVRGCSEIEAGWAAEEAFVDVHGYAQEPVTGRIRTFLDERKKQEIVNFPIQSSAAGIVNLATLRIDAQYPLDFGGPFTGLVNQCHDALMLEVPESAADEVMVALVAAMSGASSALPGVVFGADAGKGRRWAKQRFFKSPQDVAANADALRLALAAGLGG